MQLDKTSVEVRKVLTYYYNLRKAIEYNSLTEEVKTKLDGQLLDEYSEHIIKLFRK